VVPAEERALLWPKKLVWHEEPWLSTALHAALRSGIDAIKDLPKRVRDKVQEDTIRFQAKFEEGAVVPSFISCRRETEGLETYAVVPPPKQRMEIVTKAHTLGHFSARRTCQRIEEAGAWWVGMEADVTTVVERCGACARDGAHRVKFHAAQSIPIPMGVFDRVHMDLLELPLAQDGSRYVLLFVDALSKFPIAYTTESKEAEEVAGHLWSTIAMFGPMVCLHSDNGAEFVNKVVDTLATLHGIERHLITAYRPQANGLVERVNRILVAVLRKVSAETPDLWPEWLDFVMLAMRTAVNSSTGFSPFQVFFGREFHPLENYAAFQWEDGPDWEEGGVAWEAMVRRVIQVKSVMEQEWREAAGAKGRAVADRQRRSTDKSLGKKVVVERLKSGATVLVRKRVLNNKLQHRFEGPYVVVRDAVDPTTTPAERAGANYILRDMDGLELVDSFPRDQVFEVPQPSARLSLRQQSVFDQADILDAIKEVTVSRPGPVPQGGEGELQQGDGEPGEAEPRFAVNRIEGVRKRGPKRCDQVLVRWVGYPEPEWMDETVFEPEDLSFFKRQWSRLTNKRKKLKEQQGLRGGASDEKEGSEGDEGGAE